MPHFSSPIETLSDLKSAAGSKRCFVWHRSALLDCYQAYSACVNYLANDQTACLLLAQCVDLNSQDCLARVLVSIFNENRRTLSLIRDLIFRELSQSLHSRSKGSLLRSNSFLTKVEGVFVRTISHQFLKETLGNFVYSIISNHDLSLEIDANQIYYRSGQKIDLERNMLLLQNKVLELLKCIFDPQVVNAMPRQLRAVAAFTGEAANTFCPEQTIQLIGGFVMLRVFCPAIIAPEVYKILPVEIPVTENARRNLVLIVKSLQTLANGVVLEKEQYMAPMKFFFEAPNFNGMSLFNMMQDFLITLATDNLYAQGKLSSNWQDLFNEIQIKQISVECIDRVDLFELHRLLYSSSSRFVELLKSDTNQKNHSDFISILYKLPPPPLSTQAERENDKEEVTSMSITKVQNANPQNFALFEKAKFFYQGPIASENQAVFYFILSRLQREHLHNLNILSDYLNKVMEPSVRVGKFFLVVDCSWHSRALNGMKTELLSAAHSFWMTFPPSFHKNLQKFFIVYPNTLTKRFMAIAKSFVSPKTWKKVIEIYNWKQLSPHIKISNINLPDTSKGFITKSYTVTKINAKGKRQERLIKFTLDSFLNIDPRSMTIKNETKISEIEFIFSEEGSSTLILIFTAEKLKESYNNVSFLQDAEDKAKRTYEFSSVSAKESLMRDIFDGGFDLGFLRSQGKQQPQQEFKVEKLNDKGKRRDRILKLTIDSLMCLNGKTIKSEIALSGVESLSTQQNNLVVMRILNEQSLNRFVTNEAKQICDVLNDRIRILLSKNFEDTQQLSSKVQKNVGMVKSSSMSDLSSVQHFAHQHSQSNSHTHSVQTAQQRYQPNGIRPHGPQYTQQEYQPQYQQQQQQQLFDQQYQHDHLQQQYQLDHLQQQHDLQQQQFDFQHFDHQHEFVAQHQSPHSQL